MQITKYYDTQLKKHIHVIGYFNVKFGPFRELAQQFADEVGVPIDSVAIDEIKHSRRFLHFMYLHSAYGEQMPLPDSKVMDDVFDWLED
jgi:hypothetical protein